MVESNRLETILPSLQKGIVAPVHAGQIKHFIHNRALITQDPWVLQSVQGFCLPLTMTLTQTVASAEMAFSAELDFSGNANVNSKGSGELTGTSPSQFRLPVVSGSQKRWRFPVSSELEGSQ